MKLQTILKIQVAFLILVVSSSFAFAGQEGNGGNGVVCYSNTSAASTARAILIANQNSMQQIDPFQDAHAISSVEAYDLYLARQSGFGTSSDPIIQSDLKWRDLVQERLSILNTKSGFYKLFQFAQTILPDENWIGNLGGVANIADFGTPTVLPANCVFGQIGVQQGDRVIYHKVLFNLLSNVDKAAFYLHELLYWYAHNQFKMTDSTQVQKVIGTMFKTGFQGMSGLGFSNILLSAGFDSDSFSTQLYSIPVTIGAQSQLLWHGFYSGEFGWHIINEVDSSIIESNNASNIVLQPSWWLSKSMFNTGKLILPSGSLVKINTASNGEIFPTYAIVPQSLKIDGISCASNFTGLIQTPYTWSMISFYPSGRMRSCRIDSPFIWNGFTILDKIGLYDVDQHVVRYADFSAQYDIEGFKVADRNHCSLQNGFMFGEFDFQYGYDVPSVGFYENGKLAFALSATDQFINGLKVNECSIALFLRDGQLKSVLDLKSKHCHGNKYSHCDGLDE